MYKSWAACKCFCGQTLLSAVLELHDLLLAQ